jgi:hypothetical protein
MNNNKLILRYKCNHRRSKIMVLYYKLMNRKCNNVDTVPKKGLYGTQSKTNNLGKQIQTAGQKAYTNQFRSNPSK